MAQDKPRKGERTREALMAAGFKVFAEQGFLRARIGDIVGAAGKSNGVFHIYFGGKEALLDAWLDRCDAMVPWYKADIDLLFEKARDFTIESYWALYERFGPILEALDAAALANDHFATRLADLRAKGDAGIARMIRHAQDEGRCAGLDPEIAAIGIAAMLTRATAHWFRHRAALEARGIDRAAAIAQIGLLYARILGEADPVGGRMNMASEPRRART